MKHFPKGRQGYDDFYDILVGIGDIGVMSFAVRAIGLLEDYLREKHGDPCADWFRDYWTGKRGRYCIAHMRYAGSNNNIGVEVKWRDIKKLCSAGCTLSYFMSMLCKFIRTALGEEHKQALIDMGTPNAFISDPQPTKAMWDAVQDMHPKTLSCCFVLEARNGLESQALLRAMLEEVMVSGAPKAPLHLKILAKHEDNKAAGEDFILQLSDLRLVLMPRQWLLNKLDPDYKLSVDQLRAQLEDDMTEYKALVVEDWLDPNYNVKDVMRIYRRFNMIRPAPKWGLVPLECTCKVCYANAMCPCTIMLASLFKPEIRVPAHYIAATPSLRKLCRIGGTAGNKRRKLMEEAACNEKEVTSKVGYMTGTKRGKPGAPAPGKAAAPAPREFVVPEADCPSSDSSDFQVPV